MIRRLLDALALRRRIRRQRVRPAPLTPPPASVLAPDQAEDARPEPRPRFDLAAAIAAIETPAAWAALGPTTPEPIRAVWDQLFGTDCLPLACAHLHEVESFAGRTEVMVNVHLDALPLERVDLILAGITQDLDPTMAATLEFSFRRSGVLPISAAGAVIGRTEAEARARAAASQSEAR